MLPVHFSLGGSIGGLRFGLIVMCRFRVEIQEKTGNKWVLLAYKFVHDGRPTD